MFQLFEWKVMKKKNPLVFFDVSFDGGPVQRIVMEVTADMKPFIFIILSFLSLFLTLTLLFSSAFTSKFNPKCYT